jgi:hypothetical protein
VSNPVSLRRKARVGKWGWGVRSTIDEMVCKECNGRLATCHWQIKVVNVGRNFWHYSERLVLFTNNVFH